MPELRETLAAWRPLDETLREERKEWTRIKHERAVEERPERPKRPKRPKRRYDRGPGFSI